MWWSRRKEDFPNEDAELRSLVSAYSARVQNSNDPSSKTRTPPSTNPKNSFTSPTQSDTISFPPSPSPEVLPELSSDDLIRGNSFSYTPAEAKLYANEEPCDTWRHFDVHSHLFSFSSNAIRNGSIIICHYIWALITIDTEFVGHQCHTGMNSSFVSAQRV